MAWASFTRWRWPVDMVPMARKRSSPRPTCHRRVAGPTGRLPEGQAVDLGDVADEVLGGGVGRQGVVLGGVADPLAHGGAGLDRVEPEHAEACPGWDGAAPAPCPTWWSCPRRWLPSNPVMPARTVNVAPSRTEVVPHRFTRPVPTTMPSAGAVSLWWVIAARA